MNIHVIKLGQWPLLIALCAIFAVACEQDDPTGEQPTPPEPVLTITSDTLVNFPAEGGTGTISYTLENPTTETDLTISCNTNWIAEFTHASANSITYKVLASSSPNPREGIVILKYGDISRTITITQDEYTEPEIEYDVEMNASYFNGTYYGRMETEGFNYFIVLSDKGAPTSSGFYNNSTQYRLDIYSEQSGFFDPTLPEGVYEYDSQNTGRPGTFASEYSCLLDVQEYDYDQVGFVGGTITVSEDSIDAVLILKNGQTHHVTYTGPMEPGYLEIDPDPIGSTIDQDYELNITGGGLDCYYRGDRYGVGYDTWLINIIEDINSYSGKYMMFEVMIEKSQNGMQMDSFLGDYTIYNYPSEDFLGTFIPGSLRDGFTQLGSWYSRCESGFLDNSHQAPLVGGTVSISKSGYTYTFTFDCVDDLGHTIKGTFSGNVRGSYDQSGGW